MLVSLSAAVALGACKPQETRMAQQHSSTQHADALVKRLTPQFAGKVKFKLSDAALTPTISGRGSAICITAKNERECIRAYGYYLRNIAHVHFSWNGDNTSGAQFVIPTTRINVPAALPFNYAYNYCTLSYTGAHWDKARWERELDLLALNGFQYVLVTSGLEKVWQNFLRELDYPEEKIMAFIPNPAYSAWWNMGNLEGEGGPISQSLIDSEAELGQFIVKRLRELGMEPVLQGYVGFLPHDLPQAGINGKILPQGKWCEYDRPSVLQPTAEAFPGIAELWYKHLHAVYGITGKVYGGDLFHEGGKKGDTDLKAAAEAVQKAMQAASKDSIWLLQAWGGNPAKQLLQGCSPEHTIILALNKNLSPEGPQQLEFGNIPYVWCELANFGGNTGLYGGAEILETLSTDKTNAIGIGLISEGLETNPLYYALLYERVNNRGGINRERFLHHYAQARYGCKNEKLMKALNIILDELYTPDRMREGCLENIMCARPHMNAVKASTWSNPTMYYSAEKVEEAARLLLQAGLEEGEALSGLETYRYDLVDLCRQVLANRARVQLQRCKEAYVTKRDAAAFARESEAFLQLIRDTAEVLRCSEHFLLGAYLEGAENRGKTDEDKKTNTESLRRLITTWRRDISVLNDYAHREYAELMQYHYLERWKAYFENCAAHPENADKIDMVTKRVTTNNGERVEYAKIEDPRIDAIDTAFATAKVPLLKKPTGDFMKVAAKILLNQ